ncbi:beta-lactamase/transpeptidase-like protein [Hyaloraphidium curvatum]|nr:beta-lactamase/transpeptidase-like protein [Hyaloraphidium curvatum]
MGPSPTPRERALAALASLSRLTSGRLGVAALHLESGLSLEYNAHELFPMASTVKLPVALAVLAAEERGEIAPGELIPVEVMDVSIEYPEVVWGGHPGAAFSVANLLEMMMTLSDNTATDVLLRRIGGVAAVRKHLESMGMEVGDGKEINPVSTTKEFLQRSWPELFDVEDTETPLRDKYAKLEREQPELAERYQASRMPPNPAALDAVARDKASPAGMVKLMAKMFSGEGASAEARERITGVMSRCRDTRRFRAGMPPGVRAGNKTGTIRGCQNDIGYVILPDNLGTVLFAGYIRNGEGQIARGETEPGEVRHDVLARTAAAVYWFFYYEAEG